MDLATTHLQSWAADEQVAEEIVPLAGRLYREKAVVPAVFGTNLVGKTPVEMLSTFVRAGRFAGFPIRPADVVTLLAALQRLDVGRSRVDLGKLLVRFRESGSGSLADWADEGLAPLVAAPQALPSEPRDVVLYGFGRVGRLIARILIHKTGGGDKHRLKAIVLRPPGVPDLARRGSLLQFDSVHGRIKGTVDVDTANNALIVNGNYIHVMYANAPEEPDYLSKGIRDAVVIDNTGKWRDRKGLSRHLDAKGVSSVILTAPASGDVPNLVFGVNHLDHKAGERVFSAASCTTNAIVPVLKVVSDRWGIRRGHVETIHAYTNDQNLTDNFHKKDRRGRSAPLNMVITSTEASKAAAKALPALEGRLTASAIRVPTPNVSLAILQLELERETTKEELNAHIRRVAMDSPLESMIYYTISPELVSTDLVGNPHASLYDSEAAIVRGSSVVLYVWYDNEYGYSCQVVRLFQHLTGISPKVFPTPSAI